MELTKFGKFVRMKRVLRSMKLGEMARLLDASSSYLSSVETGRKAIPKEWPDKIAAIFELTDKEVSELKRAAEHHPGIKKVVTKSSEEAALIAAFSNRQGELDRKQLSFFTELIETAGKDKS